MASWDDVRRRATALPEVSEGELHGELRAWRVKDKLFAWERPLRAGDRAALGDDAPADPILAVRVPDVGAREALIAAEPGVFFTIPHFAGYPAVLVRLDAVDPAELGELVEEAWLCRAPKRLAAAHREEAVSS